jgi:tetratricopeptide (TPR) repeat protein
MAKTTCVVCRNARGRRLCRLKEQAAICPVCCAGLRNQACEGCSHWSQAASFAEQKAAAAASGRREPHFVAEINPAIDEEVDGAMKLAETGRLAEAERAILDVYSRRPDLHMVQYGMGVVRALQKRLPEAIVHFERAVSIYPYFVEAWFNKGNAHRELLQLGPAVRAFEKVVEFGDPADEFVGHASKFLRGIEQDIRAQKGLSLSRYLELTEVFDEAFSAMEKQQWERALEGFRRVAALDPEHAQSYGNIGLCLAFLGRKNEALAALDRALDIDPDYGPALTNRAHILALQDGEPLSADFVSVDFYKDRMMKRG